MEYSSWNHLYWNSSVEDILVLSKEIYGYLIICRNLGVGEPVPNSIIVLTLFASYWKHHETA